MKNPMQVKKTLLMAAAISTVAVPLFVSAAIKQETQRNTVAHAAGARDAAQTPQALYQRLKDASRKMCGPTNLVVTGSIERVVGNESCYQGTLEAAVQRLDDPAVSELFEREVSQL